MGIVIRQSLKGTVVTYLGVLIGFVNTLWLYPKILSPDEIGLFRTLIDGSYLLVVLAQLGGTNICVRYFPFFRNKDQHHGGFLFFILSISLLGFFLIVLTLGIFEDNILAQFNRRSPLLMDFKLFVIPLLLVTLFQTTFEAYSQSLLRIVYPKFLKEVIVRLLFSLAVILVHYQALDLYGFITATVLIYTTSLFLLVIYVGHLGHLYLRPNFQVFKSEKFKDIATFGFYMLLGTGGGMIVNKIDTIMLSSLAGLASTGIYSIAFFIGVFIELPRRSLAGITNPLIAEAWKNDNLPEIQRIYTKSSENLLLVGLFLFIGVWLNIDALFTLIPNSEIYRQGKFVVLLIGIAKIVNLSLGNNAEIITNSPYYRWNIFLMPALAVLTVASNFLLIPVYGINGAALATLISFIIYCAFRLLVAWWKLGIQPFSFNTLKSLVIFGVVMLIGSLIPSSPGALLDIIVTSLAVTALFGGLVLVLKPSPDLHQLVRGFASKYLRR